MELKEGAPSPQSGHRPKRATQAFKFNGRKLLPLSWAGAVYGTVLTTTLLVSPFSLIRAVADTEQAGGSVSIKTPVSSIPYPIFPIGTVITNFTAYGEAFPYVTRTFSVNVSGTYSAELLTPSVQNGFYLLQGAFSPSLDTPSTPLSSFIAFTQNLNASSMSFHLQAGVTYSYLAIFSLGNSPYTFTIGGPGCIALSTTCWIDTSKPFFIESDSRARGETLVFDGGSLRPTRSVVFAQPVTLRAAGGVIDTSTASSVTVSGKIMGAGGLTIKGGNSVLLTGKNTYAGGTKISAGTVVGNSKSFGTGAILNNGTLVLDQARDDTFAVSLAGSGSLIKQGKGRLDLTGRSALEGPTEVQAGTLAVNGSLGNSRVILAQGAKLSGHGIVGNLEAGTGSVVAPGESIGKLKVKGNVHFAPQSTYEVEINDAGQSDTVTAAGIVYLSQRTILSITPVDGKYQTAVPYLILRSKGGIRGKFEAVDTRLSELMDTILQYTSNTVTLTLQPKATYAEVHSSAVTSTYSDGLLLQSALLSRLRQPPRDGAYAASADTVKASGLKVWGEPFGSWGQIGRYHDAAALDRSTTGFILGVETQLDESHSLGIAGGFSRTVFDIDGRMSSGSNESTFGAVYGTAAWKTLQFRFGAFYAGHNIDTDRRSTLPGPAERIFASYNGSALQAFGEIGYPLGGENLQIEPFLGASALRLRTNHFAENGGTFALNGYSRAYDLGTTTIGVRASARIGSELPLMLNALLGWRHAYGDVTPKPSLASLKAISNLNGIGVVLDRDALVAEMGLDLQTKSSAGLGIAYQTQVGARAQEHALKGKLSWSF